MNSAYNAALGFLARREHSSYELRSKLQLKDFSDESIEDALIRLQKNHLQSDHRFAEHYIRYRSQKGFGPVRIAQELREKQVSSDIYQSIFLTIDWVSIMRTVYHKKFSTHVVDAKDRAKRHRFLLQRGFYDEDIRCVLEDAHDD